MTDADMQRFIAECERQLGLPLSGRQSLAELSAPELRAFRMVARHMKARRPLQIGATAPTHTGAFNVPLRPPLKRHTASVAPEFTK